MHALLAAEGVRQRRGSVASRQLGPAAGGEILLKCRGGATEMLVTKGEAREVIADPKALKALVADNRGVPGRRRGRAARAVDMIPARAEFYTQTRRSNWTNCCFSDQPLELLPAS